MRASEEFGFGGGPRRWASEIHPQGGELVSQARDQQPEIWARFGLRPETVVSISPLAPVAQEAVASYTHSDLDIRAQGIGIPGVLARYINRRTSACKTSLRRGAESVDWGGGKVADAQLPGWRDPAGTPAVGTPEFQKKSGRSGSAEVPHQTVQILKNPVVGYGLSNHGALLFNRHLLFEVGEEVFDQDNVAEVELILTEAFSNQQTMPIGMQSHAFDERQSVNDSGFPRFGLVRHKTIPFDPIPNNFE